VTLVKIINSKMTDLTNINTVTDLQAMIVDGILSIVVYKMPDKTMSNG